MTSIELHNPQTALEEKMNWSRAMSGGDLLPQQYRNKPANLMFAAEYADSLGVGRIHVLTSIAVINGRPSPSADLMAAMVRAHGHKLRVYGEEGVSATADLIRSDDPDFTFTATWDEAKARKAGLWGNKGPWTQYTNAMLRARAISEVVRMGAQDVMAGGIYTPEELGANVGPDGVPVEGGEVDSERVHPRQQQRRQQPQSPAEAVQHATADTPPGRTLTDDEIGGVFDKIAGAADEAQLKAIWDHAETLVEEQREMIRQGINSELKARQTATAAPTEEPDPTVEDAAAVVQETIDAEYVEEPAA